MDEPQAASPSATGPLSATLPGGTEEDLSPRAMRLFLAATGLALVLTVATGALWIRKQNARAQERIVCFGDSLTTCGGYGGRYSDFLAQALPEMEIVNQGSDGETLAGGMTRFGYDVLALRPKVLVLELGANDFLNGRAASEIRKDLDLLVGAARDRGCEVVLAGVFGDQVDEQGKIVPKLFAEGDPELGQAILQAEREIAQRYDALHVENIQADLNLSRYWSDNRHPNALGNQKVAERLLPAIQEALRRAAKRQGERQ